MTRAPEHIDAGSLDPGNLAFEWPDGRILFANGRAGYSFYGTVTLADALEAYDVYVAWVKSGNGSHADWTPSGMRDVIIRAHGLGGEHRDGEGGAMSDLLDRLGIKDRAGVEMFIERLIAMLDHIDGDPDFEERERCRARGNRSQR